jgi:hypothetical protein
VPALPSTDGEQPDGAPADPQLADAVIAVVVIDCGTLTV